jgi:hypothetical protein
LLSENPGYRDRLLGECPVPAHDAEQAEVGRVAEPEPDVRMRFAGPPLPCVCPPYAKRRRAGARAPCPGGAAADRRGGAAAPVKAHSVGASQDDADVGDPGQDFDQVRLGCELELTIKKRGDSHADVVVGGRDAPGGGLVVAGHRAEPEGTNGPCRARYSSKATNCELPRPNSARVQALLRPHHAAFPSVTSGRKGRGSARSMRRWRGPRWPRGSQTASAGLRSATG